MGWGIPHKPTKPYEPQRQERKMTGYNARFDHPGDDPNEIRNIMDGVLNSHGSDDFGNIVVTKVPTMDEANAAEKERAKKWRKVEVPTLDMAIELIPVTWEEYGGAPAIRYTVRTTELKNLLVDMIEEIDNVEMDARYYLEDGTDVEKFKKNVGDLLSLGTHLVNEAREVREVMGF